MMDRSASDLLERFVEAQQPVIDAVQAELAAGSKRTHWMWFVFPQIAGLGHSAMAQHYALRSVEDARGYLAHPILGPRLAQCVSLVLKHGEKSLGSIFGSPDDLKFVSSMTLFDLAADDDNPPFRRALALFNNGERDEATLRLANATRGP